MKTLKKVLMEALVEQDPQGLDNVIEFPNENFMVSIDRNRKKLIFSPQQHSSLPSKLRTMLTMLKQRFNIIKVNSLEDEDDAGQGDTDDPNLRGVFEIVVDPREDFEAVVDFVRNSMDREEEYEEEL
jgi:hypothetical protein